MTIISSIPNKIINNTIADATQTMNNFNSIMAEVNAQAAGLNQPNAFTVQPTGVPGTLPASFPIISQIQNNSIGNASTNTGTVDALIGVYSPIPAVLSDGAVFSINITSPNLTTTPTFTPSGGVITPRTIIKAVNIPLMAGDLIGPVKLQYNGISDNFILLNPSYGIAVPPAIQNNTFAHASTNVGTADAVIAAYTPPPPSPLVDGMVFTVNITSPNLTATPTFTPNNGIIAPVVITKNYGQALLPGDLLGAIKLEYIALLSAWSLLNPATPVTPQIQTVDGSCAGNALTITINPMSLDFRSASAGSGVVTRVILAAQSTLVIPFTATLGTLSAIPARLVILAINSSGVIEPAIVNLAGGVNLDTSGLLNTVAIVAGSNNAGIVYSTTQRTGVPFRIVGYIDITQATPGTWITRPSKIQGISPETMADLTSLGTGQTWQNLTGSRASGATYYNTTGRAIQISITAQASFADPATAALTVNGILVANNYVPAAAGYFNYTTISAIIPPGASYVGTVFSSLLNWAELR